jgi:hypothetical protein
VHGAFVVPVAEMIAVLNPFAGRRKHLADFYTNWVSPVSMFMKW